MTPLEQALEAARKLIQGDATLQDDPMDFRRLQIPTKQVEVKRQK